MSPRIRACPTDRGQDIGAFRGDERSDDGSAARAPRKYLARTLRAEAGPGRRLDAMRRVPGDAVPQAGRAEPARLPRVQPSSPCLGERTDQSAPRQGYLRG